MSDGTIYNVEFRVFDADIAAWTGPHEVEFVHDEADVAGRAPERQAVTEAQSAAIAYHDVKADAVEDAVEVRLNTLSSKPLA